MADIESIVAESQALERLSERYKAALMATSFSIIFPFLFYLIGSPNTVGFSVLGIKLVLDFALLILLHKGYPSIRWILLFSLLLSIPLIYFIYPPSLQPLSYIAYFVILMGIIVLPLSVTKKVPTLKTQFTVVKQAYIDYLSQRYNETFILPSKFELKKWREKTLNFSVTDSNDYSFNVFMENGQIKDTYILDYWRYTIFNHIVETTSSLLVDKGLEDELLEANDCDWFNIQIESYEDVFTASKTLPSYADFYQSLKEQGLSVDLYYVLDELDTSNLEAQTTFIYGFFKTLIQNHYNFDFISFDSFDFKVMFAEHNENMEKVIYHLPFEKVQTLVNNEDLSWIRQQLISYINMRDLVLKKD